MQGLEANDKCDGKKKAHSQEVKETQQTQAKNKVSASYVNDNSMIQINPITRREANGFL